MRATVELFQIREPSAEVAGKCAPEDLAIVEAQLDVCFPQSYKHFLLNYGALHSSYGAVSGVFPGIPSSKSAGTVLGDTLRCRQNLNLPPTFLVVQVDIDGREPWCLNMGALNSQGEAPVVCFNQSGTIVPLYPSFGEYLNAWLSQSVES